LIKIVEAFDQTAQSYDSWYDHPQGKQVLEAEINAVQHMIPSKGIGLEVGAGTGVFAKGLRGPDRPIICLDPSKEMLSKSVERCNYVILGSGENIPLRPVISFTYMVAVLEFIQDPNRVFMEAKRTTKNGSLIILFINAESLWGKFYRNLGSKGDPVFRHAHLYSMENVTKLLSHSGYKIQKMIGTLTTGPMDEKVGGEIVEPDSSSGVIVLKAIS
jgi:ubiquinone/menaquinone biosynthesis C-methylase UbiE